MSVTTILLVMIPIALMVVLLSVGRGSNARPRHGLPHGVAGPGPQETGPKSESKGDPQGAEDHQEGQEHGCC